MRPLITNQDLTPTCLLVRAPQRLGWVFGHRRLWAVPGGAYVSVMFRKAAWDTDKESGANHEC